MSSSAPMYVVTCTKLVGKRRASDGHRGLAFSNLQRNSAGKDQALMQVAKSSLLCSMAET